MNPTIVKCLELSNSKNDAEALSAIRKANLLLKQENNTWSKLFKIPAGKRLKANGASKGISLQKMLETLSVIELPESQRGIIDYIFAKYHSAGRLSSRHQTMVSDIYEAYYCDDLIDTQRRNV